MLGDATLKQTALEIVMTVRANATIDWNVKETVRVMVRRLLATYCYPPDRRENAVRLVLEQAETLGSSPKGSVARPLSTPIGAAS